MRRPGRALMLAGLLLVLASLVLPLSKCSFLHVVSGSMEPYLPVGSLVLLCPSEPLVGDVAAYSLYGSVIIHRVASADTASGTLFFSADLDPARPSVVESRRVLGVAVLALPLLGYLGMLRQHVMFAVMVAGLFWLLHRLYNMGKREWR
ncbi:MAG: hypothetical protein QXP81_09125 [Nitrososphaerota archaeon]